MAGEKLIFFNRYVVLGGRRISLDARSVDVPIKRNVVDTSAIEDKRDRKAKGTIDIGTVSLDILGTDAIYQFLQGVWQAEAAIPLIALLEPATSVAAWVGKRALALHAHVLDLTLKLARGDVYSMGLTLAGTDAVGLGHVLYCNLGQTVLSASGAAPSPVNLGAVGAGYELQLFASVVDPPGIGGSAAPTITTRVESDDDPGMASVVTRHTFTARTTIGGESAVIDGDVTPISDDEYRAAWVISGTSPQFTQVVVASRNAKT